MSKWTDIRDGELDAMKQGALNVAEETKRQFMTNFIEAGVPVVEIGETPPEGTGFLDYFHQIIDELEAVAA